MVYKYSNGWWYSYMYHTHTIKLHWIHKMCVTALSEYFTSNLYQCSFSVDSSGKCTFYELVPYYVNSKCIKTKRRSLRKRNQIKPDPNSRFLCELLVAFSKDSRQTIRPLQIDSLFPIHHLHLFIVSSWSSIIPSLCRLTKSIMLSCQLSLHFSVLSSQP